MTRIAIAAALLGAALAAGAAAPAPARAEVEWLCRPGVEPNPCHESLETTVYEDGGASHVENPPLAANAPIDCFYVYPTVSGQPGTNANKDRDEELVEIARYQAARFSQNCRIFAPIYRQLTLASIFTGTAEQRAQGGKLAYGDVREAWRDYLQRYNGGRGFVLIGHSQGTRMLRQLVREEIDPDPLLRRRLVSAILLGGNVLVRRGQRAGGDFQNVPACQGMAQTGCVIAFSTFNEPPPDNSRFGRSPPTDTSGANFPAGPDYEVLCTNPASLDANARTPLTSYLRSEPFPGGIGAALVVMYGGPPPSAPTPWVRPAERYSGRCEQSAGANVFMLQSIGSARKLNPSPDPSWGLHLADANIALGELVSTVAAETQAYLGQAPRACLPARLRLAAAGLGGLALRRGRGELAGRAGAGALRRGGRAYRWCVAGGGTVTVVFSRTGGGVARLVFTTAPGHRAGGVGAGSRLVSLRRRFPHARRQGGGVYRAGTLVFGVRRGRVRFAGVADRALARRPRLLAAYLRRARAGR